MGAGAPQPSTENGLLAARRNARCSTYIPGVITHQLREMIGFPGGGVCLFYRGGQAQCDY